MNGSLAANQLSWLQIVIGIHTIAELKSFNDKIEREKWGP